MATSSVLVLGGGKVGKSVAELLLMCGKGNYRVTLADRDEVALHEARANLEKLAKALPHASAFDILKIDASDLAAVRQALTGKQYVICMLPYQLVGSIPAIANELGVHYFDVTEDVAATDNVRRLHDQGQAKVALVPQCGLAPGYIAIAANHVSKDFDQIHELTLRVGALPQFPTNALKYNVTWSAAGLINEYCEPCNVMLNGQMMKTPALEGLEHFSFEGVEYEAFYTSGGVGSLIESLKTTGKTGPNTTIAYKTIRYPGHRDLMKFLLEDLRLGLKHAEPTRGGRTFDRAAAIDLVDTTIPRTLQDVVVIFVNCVGLKNGRRHQVNLKTIVRAQELFGRVWPAIESTTAAGVCAMVDMHREGKLPAKTGFIRQESVSLDQFHSTIFGQVYADVSRVEARVRA
jgi:saccharopine dehydrogenase-like NADP-dependent oxidoreductase